MPSVSLIDERARTAVTHMGDCAGIDDIDIGDIVKVALCEARCAHLLANSLAIGLIYFAAKCGNCKCLFFYEIVMHNVLLIFWCQTVTTSRNVPFDYSA